MEPITLTLTEYEVCYLLEALMGELNRWEMQDQNTVKELHKIRNSISAQLMKPSKPKHDVLEMRL